MGANKEGGMEFKENKKRIKDKDYCTVRRTPCSSLRGLSGKLQAADWLPVDKSKKIFLFRKI